MKAITKFLAVGAAVAALVAAAPATAQYYPGYGDPYEGNPVGQVLNDVFGGGRANSQVAVNQCASAVQARLGGYGYNGYGYGGGRVLGISRVEGRSNGGLTVRGVASSGRYAGYPNGAQLPVDLTWKCKTDFRGYVTQVDINRAQPSYGYNYNNNYNDNSTPYDYSQYGYHRY